MSHEMGGYFNHKLFCFTMVLFSMVAVSEQTFHHPNHLLFLLIERSLNDLVVFLDGFLLLHRC